MPHSETLGAIRDLVRRSFAALGAEHGIQLSEHILIRDDLYCGRRFRCADLQAVWFIEEDQIKVYGRDGTVVRVLHASHVSEAAGAGVELSRAA